MKISLGKIWRVGRVVLVVLIILYVGLVIYRIPAIAEQEDTRVAVAHIESQRITPADVAGDNLPPIPDPAKVDATVEGVDVNKNGIRDDVELAIFKLHPDSARVRAAELQYAKGLQMYLTDTFNSETWRAVSDQEDRGYFCISEVFQYLRPDRETATEEEWNVYFAIAGTHREEVEDWVFNTQTRKGRYEEVFAKYQVSSGSDRGHDCDLNLENLSD